MLLFMLSSNSSYDVIVVCLATKFTWQLMHEEWDVTWLDESGTFRIIVCPKLCKQIVVVDCRETCFILFRLSIGLDHECDEEVDQKHLCQDYIEDEEYVGELRATALDPLSLPIFKLLIFHTLYSIICGTIGQLLHDQIPTFTCHTSNQQEQCITETLEVGILIVVLLQHDAMEHVHSQDCEDKDDQPEQTHNVD